MNISMGDCFFGDIIDFADNFARDFDIALEFGCISFYWKICNKIG